MDRPDAAPEAEPFDEEFDLQVAARLRAAFARSRHPMLIADDHRRWVAGNEAACELLGLAQEAVSWHTMDDFTPLSERPRLKQQWVEFLARGEAGGRYELYVPGHEPFPVEFGAIANVLPRRHLALFIPADEGSAEQAATSTRVGEWRALMAARDGRLPLSKREREIMTLAAAGGQSGDMAESLYLSPETIKSHIQNAMAKLGAHTRAHAVAIALVTGQIAWTDDSLPSG
ncbi:MAG: LuxR C-terminal-related transcriptional regulator [Solirubrobacteraceae bacterium]|nr:LuxR C-terminal-related transcriptional regulator [Solirubrobacteraceae bacterium]